MRTVTRSTRLSNRDTLRLAGSAVAFAAALGGCSTTFLSDLLRPHTKVTQISPAKGPAAGGTKVTIVGEVFGPDVGVVFGASSATQVTVLNDKLIEAITPPGPAGPADVTLLSTGEQAVVLPGGFEYEAEPSPAPVPPTVATVAPTAGPSAGGTVVTLIGANFKSGTLVLFGGQLATSTTILNSQAITAVTPAHSPGRVDLSLVTPSVSTLTVPSAFEFTAPVDLGTAPRIVGAVATSNTGVQVVFSKPMGEGAEVSTNYEIRGTGTAFLVVTAAKLRSGDPTTVDLTTLGQAADIYTLHVSGVKDTFGQNLASPSGIETLPGASDPSRAKFAGIPPGGQADQIDSDGDGIADWSEMAGWDIQTTTVDKRQTIVHVTSDPFNPDTDGDGLTDAEERGNGFDPRTNDTDGDLIPDFAEFNEWYSDATSQDSDGDGITDYLEIALFKTSPILADTDGDQWTDSDELFNRSRNPRCSDIPLPQIRVGTIGIFIKETYSYTDERGATQSDSTSKTTKLHQSTERKQSTSDTQSGENTDKYSQELGTEFTIGGKDPFGGFKIEAKVGFEQTRQRGYESTVDNESTVSSAKDFEEARQFGSTLSENRTFSRTIDEAALTMDVTISNLGDVAFTISDLELSALVRNPQQREDVPLATLLSEREIQTGQPQAYNLGPFDTDRGPFIFKDIQIFPNVADDLRKSPQAVTVKIANFNIRDESGRLFAFSSQDINDRTAGIIIDYGNGEVEAFRVATANKFDATGHPLGITMRTALEDVLGIDATEGGDIPVTPENEDTDAIRNSYGTALDAQNVEILTRIRGVQTTLSGPVRDRKFWAIIASAPIPTDTNFSDIVLNAGQNYSLQFVSDRDADGLFASVEFLYGSSDDNWDTDSDGIGDYDEVRTGWLLGIPGAERRVYSDPTLSDSDGDDLTDLEERDLRTDPRQRDSDDDGIPDRAEVIGYEVVLFDGNDDPTDNPVIQLTPYTDAAVIDGGDGVADTAVAAGSDDLQVVPVGSYVQPGAAVILPGPNGKIDSTPAGDEFVDAGQKIIDGGDGLVNTSVAPGSDDIQLFPLNAVVPAGTPIIAAGLNGRIDTTPAGDDRKRAAHGALFASDPLQRDTDADALPDGRETYLGSNPNNPTDAGTVVDTDFDGLVDADELNGWDITVNGVTRQVTSDPLEADTDADGLPDLMERIFRMDPRQRDTDADGLPDRIELDPTPTIPARTYFPAGTYDAFLERCATAQDCVYTRPDHPIGTNPLAADTDADGINDGDEINNSWVVRVYLEDDRTVQSDAFLADEDQDGLNDLEERQYGTDPKDPDTDGDQQYVGGTTAYDGYEVKTRGTEPLKPDEKVSFTLTNVWINGDCDGDAVGLPGIELSGGEIYYTSPDGVDTRCIAAFPCMGEYSGSVENGKFADCPWTREFTLEIGQSYRVHSTTFIDQDGNCLTPIEEAIGSFENTFTFPSDQGNWAFTVTKDSDCGLTVNAVISVY